MEKTYLEEIREELARIEVPEEMPPDDPVNPTDDSVKPSDEVLGAANEKVKRLYMLLGQYLMMDRFEVWRINDLAGIFEYSQTNEVASKAMVVGFAFVQEVCRQFPILRNGKEFDIRTGWLIVMESTSADPETSEDDLVNQLPDVVSGNGDTLVDPNDQQIDDFENEGGKTKPEAEQKNPSSDGCRKTDDEPRTPYIGQPSAEDPNDDNDYPTERLGEPFNPEQKISPGPYDPENGC